MERDMQEGDLLEGGVPSNGFHFLEVNPHTGGIRDLFKYWVFGDVISGAKFLDGSDPVGVGTDVVDHRWVILVSVMVRKVVMFFKKPLEWTGILVEFLLNLVSLNGGFLGLFCNFILAQVVMPCRDSDTFISAIGNLDGRIDLYKPDLVMEDYGGLTDDERLMKIEMGNRFMMDLCIMASKLAYENSKVVKNVVIHRWKMHFVDFYNCWNDYQKQLSTQVFILCDKPVNANLILISFRGTEPFDADHWCTDFDYSWYEIPELGKVHMGFLEALGLGNRANKGSFQNLLLNYNTLGEKQARASKIVGDSNSTNSRALYPEMEERNAYFVVRSKLKDLLTTHKNAKFVVTGHSLGGALAILFPTVLVLQEELEMMRRLLGVYTFGQPRVGDKQMHNFMESHLNYPVPKYFRVVYCNDLVPRIPYDDKIFLYKHFGVCLYYDSLYNEKRVDEEPNRNFFGPKFLIPEYLNAFWELIRGLLMGYLHGPEYEEGWFSILIRTIGLVLPGISAHSPRDYVNSVRLGREQ
ncbi:hypothetical protein MLD38_004778 [Melastoma candidum]|uniref:Uncharacterized protein n=1 Tax=Melastoma candidum TaxID=119954 RepID=A0ACB9S7N0_9MYRT|nr:hypothetical protein MLD38_004778 [Melastoma candidum]